MILDVVHHIDRRRSSHAHEIRLHSFFRHERIHPRCLEINGIRKDEAREIIDRSWRQKVLNAILRGCRDIVINFDAGTIRIPLEIEGRRRCIVRRLNATNIILKENIRLLKPHTIINGKRRALSNVAEHRFFYLGTGKAQIGSIGQSKRLTHFSRRIPAGTFIDHTHGTFNRIRRNDRRFGRHFGQKRHTKSIICIRPLFGRNRRTRRALHASCKIIHIHFTHISFSNRIHIRRFRRRRHL
jgi:hypothetical protein